MNTDRKIVIFAAKAVILMFVFLTACFLCAAMSLILNFLPAIYVKIIVLLMTGLVFFGFAYKLYDSL